MFVFCLLLLCSIVCCWCVYNVVCVFLLLLLVLFMLLLCLFDVVIVCVCVCFVVVGLLAFGYHDY